MSEFVSSESGLHWDNNVERRGLGSAIVRVNHIALIVSDVGRSASFYSDILGLQQIKRPAFDRYGAWFTMGNCELHLIKGKPIVHDGTNLIVGHISLEVTDTNFVFKKLREFGIPFEQNMSVPKGVGKAASEGGDMENTLMQYFVRDPDGYYIELCNCQILTDFCLGKAKYDLSSYTEGYRLPFMEALEAVRLLKLVKLAKARIARRPQLRDVISQIKRAETVNPELLNNFMKRRLIYGDLCQSFSPEELEEIVLESGNHAPSAILIMQLEVKQNGKSREFQPPGYFIFDSNRCGDLFKPRTFCVDA